MTLMTRIKGLLLLIGLAVLLGPLSAQAWDLKSESVLSPAPIFAKNGMVSSAHPMASLIGINILQQGGNAFDAAVGTAVALSAVDMAMCGPGGASFWLLWDAKQGKLYSLDADTQAPAAATPAAFKDRGELLSGLKAMGLPGNMMAYWTVLEKHGTMSFEQIIAPTLPYLEEGFVLSQRQSHNYKNQAAQAPLMYPNLARVFAPEGEWDNAGTMMRNPELAQTYRTVAKEGIDAFYKGSIAKAMVDYMQANGGLWTMQDLANYQVKWVEPLKMSYRDYTVYGVPPPSASVTWMEMLKIAEGYDWSKIPDNSLEYLHLMVEIDKLAHADSYQFVADPAFVENVADHLVSDTYAAAQRQRIDLNRAAQGKVVPGDPKAWSRAVPPKADLPVNMQGTLVAMQDSVDNMTYRGNTNHVVITDKWGNCVTFTHTLGQFFGGQDILGNTGVIGNNGMDWFDLDINPWTEKPSALVVEPGKRNRWTLSPGMIFQDGKPVILTGGSGAESTMGGIFQVMIRMLEYKLNPQAAISSPRFLFGDMYHYTAGARLHIEPELRDHRGLGPKMVEMGHDMVPGDLIYRMSTGNVWAIQLDPGTGTFAGGSEIRGDGHAVGY